MTDLSGTGITMSDDCNSWKAENLQHLPGKEKNIIFYTGLQNIRGTNKPTGKEKNLQNSTL